MKTKVAVAVRYFLSLVNGYILLISVIGFFVTGCFHIRIVPFFLLYFIGLWACPQKNGNPSLNTVIVCVELFICWAPIFLVLAVGNILYDDGTYFFFDGGCQIAILFGYTPLVQLRAWIFRPFNQYLSSSKEKRNTKALILVLVVFLLAALSLQNGWLLSPQYTRQVVTVLMEGTSDSRMRSVFMSELFLIKAGAFLFLCRRNLIVWGIAGLCITAFMCTFFKMLPTPLHYSIFFGALYAIALPEAIHQVFCVCTKGLSHIHKM